MPRSILRRFVPSRAWLVAAALPLAFSVPARAQVHGQVVDGGGAPVAGARVELWAPLRRLEWRETDASGAFEFAAPQADSATGLVVSRVGYRARSLTVPRPAAPLQVRLSEAAVRLEAVSVRASAGRLCPNGDDPRARALWSAAAARYGSADTLSIEVDEMVATGNVPRAEIGMVDERWSRPNRRGTAPQRRAVDPVIGYGFRIASSFDPDYAAWQYLPLGSHHAQHFIDASFGTYNTLSVRGQDAEGIVLAFCSRGLTGRRAIGIEGTLTLGADTTLVSATYRFRPRDPEEDAGGEVTFVPHPGRGSLPWLVPATSLYWRALHGRRDLYFQRWERFGAWRIWKRDDIEGELRPPTGG